MNPAPKFLLCFIYILKSKVNNQLYFGYTSDLKRRFEQHNKGLNKSTAPFIPWELVYYEAYSDEERAKLREKNIKYFGKVYSQLKRRLGL